MSDRPSPRPSPTLEDVARAAGVSRATVSRVINQIRNVDPLIQAVVRQAIEETGYVPNRAARSLVTRRAGAVALVVSGAGEDGDSDEQLLTDPFFGRVATGVVNFLRPLGIHPVVMLADSTDSRDQVVADLRRGTADGALLVSTHSADTLPLDLLEAQLPTVVFARPPGPQRVSFVDLAHYDGGRIAAEHLVSIGRRFLTAISGPFDVMASQERLAGFREAAARHGQPYVPVHVGRFTQESGEWGMKALLAENPKLDAVFAANDLMGQGAVHVLREHGKRVPEDVAVVGFDDSSAATASRPALTTVRQPVEDMAAEMARLLLDHLERPEAGPSSVIFEPTLVRRQSA
ncbi:LacI family DNA-binding transcriptional regulator [Streptomyces radicis]|uniref:LacI family transcriptional regulator n=1 Tax=Streptomyces radicis TaxID=1750517 RepID=A0A3A9WDP5_9ACTN|nr:LacI family DNA-binding transcriptional regulator [Streptomyces radicis]RKN10890.1 LacI family transcriptional regulator [Streptomyces radicis]RKN25154.1 LacI family transcriptional regulator [Streptomyces radicis]